MGGHRRRPEGEGDQDRETEQNLEAFGRWVRFDQGLHAPFRHGAMGERLIR
jgi:hypothetical protein